MKPISCNWFPLCMTREALCTLWGRYNLRLCILCVSCGEVCQWPRSAVIVVLHTSFQHWSGKGPHENRLHSEVKMEHRSDLCWKPVEMGCHVRCWISFYAAHQFLIHQSYIPSRAWCWPLSPCSAEFKNAWSCTSTPSICIHGVMFNWATFTLLTPLCINPVCQTSSPLETILGYPCLWFI
jgi:hypothetical protein